VPARPSGKEVEEKIRRSKVEKVRQMISGVRREVDQGITTLVRNFDKNSVRTAKKTRHFTITKIN
jgi:hypothetical protein